MRQHDFQLLSKLIQISTKQPRPGASQAEDAGQRTRLRSSHVPLGMPNHIPVVLLLCVLVALVSDILIHSHPVHAQNSPTLYVDNVPHHFGKQHDELTIKGTQVVAFSCADGPCYVLSK
jgi:hypothetical protein